MNRCVIVGSVCHTFSDAVCETKSKCETSGLRLSMENTHTIAPINSLVLILSFYSRTILQHSAYRLLFRAYENDTGVKYTVDIIIIIITG